MKLSINLGLSIERPRGFRVARMGPFTDGHTGAICVAIVSDLFIDNLGWSRQGAHLNHSREDIKIRLSEIKIDNKKALSAVQHA